jgi:microcystin degradation protein MlrC
MRIAIISHGQETCSFTPLYTTVDVYREYGLYEGEEILEKLRGVGPVGGFLAAVEEEAIDLVPLPIIRGWAGAHGPLTAETVRFFEEKIVTGLKQALPLDGVFLSLHGAAASEEVPSVEGHLAAAARRVVGPDVPIVAPFDHHANITQSMIDALDGLVGHRTQPHDPFDTGKLAAKQLFAIIRREISPAIGWFKIPIITHQEQFLTSGGPMKAWFDLAREIEGRPGVVSASNFPMQPWLDVAEGGWAAVVITDNDLPMAQELAADLANQAWELREQFLQMDSIPPEAAIRRAVEAEKGLVVLSDTGDSVFGGSTGDSTCLLEEMLRQQIAATALVPMVDPQVVEQAIQAGEGSEITARVGGKFATAFSQPVEVTARVAKIGGGRLHAHLINLESFDVGRAVLLEVGAIKLVVSEERGIGGNHPVFYRHFGIEPAEAKMVVLKTASNWQFYSDMTNEVIRADTPGPTQSRLEQFDWVNLPRPIYPLDDLTEWEAQAGR